MTIDREAESSEPENHDHQGFAVFVSYSREDGKVVEPLVAMLRLLGRGIFRDQDSIPPGSQWRLIIKSVIEECRTMVVFWCRHSSSSKEVKQEYKRAIKLRKAVVPILLDSTEMSKDLARFQAINLRPALGVHEDLVRIPPEEGVAYMFPRFGYSLHRPSEKKMQNAAQYLLEKLGELGHAQNGGVSP